MAPTVDHTEADQAQQFSYARADAALAELFDAIPKSRRQDHLGNLNEVGVFMQQLLGFFQAVTDDEETRKRMRSLSVANLLGEYLAVVAPTTEG